VNAEALAYVGLGSNLDDPRKQVLRAFGDLEALPLGRCAIHSHLYRSRPMGPEAQPDYVNAVAELRTRLAPSELLERLHRIEAAHGRVRNGERWGARTLDLDLLLYGDRRICRPDLTLPHPGLALRAFVLLPLMEIARPGLVIPGCGPLEALAAACDRSGVERM
jgi:2-amino-4-hydroxy-6-hydroxymethyldihydropteridine diphosphokinase